MIVRILDRETAPRPDVSITAPRASDLFGGIDALQLSTGELRDMYSAEIDDEPVRSPFEAVSALNRRARCEPAVRVHNAKLARLMKQHSLKLPCFVGFQEVPGGAILPFLTDGPQGSWSLFFEPAGRMILITQAGLRLTASLLGEELAGAGESIHRQARLRSFRPGQLPRNGRCG